MSDPTPLVADDVAERALHFVRRARRWMGAILLVTLFGGAFLALDSFARGDQVAGVAVTAAALLVVVVAVIGEAVVWLLELRVRED